MRLAEFLLARIAEDEAAARDTDPLTPGAVFDHDVSGWWSADRVLAECEAKRRIVDQVSDVAWGGYAIRDAVLHLLALPYSGHPDYEEEWRP